MGQIRHSEAWMWGSLEGALAELTLLAEGMSIEQRGVYWERLSIGVRRLCEPIDRVQCVDVARDPDRVCGLCRRQAPRWIYLIRSERSSVMTIACGLCVQLLPHAARRVGGRVAIEFASPRAAQCLNQRYPKAAPDLGWRLEQYLVDVEDGPLESTPRPRIEDLAPEGLAPDEIDWESHDYE